MIAFTFDRRERGRGVRLFWRESKGDFTHRQVS